jgi:sugar phosphate isomerase/epimerase
MKFAINPATTMPYDFEADVNAYARGGFRHMELWIDKLDKYVQSHSLSQARDLLRERNIAPVCACCVGGICLSDVVTQPDRLADMKRKLKLCRDLDCPTLVAIPDFPPKPDATAYGTIEKNLASAAKIAGDHGVKLAFEFLQGNQLVATLGTAKKLVRAVNRPSLGLLIDMSHFWLDRSRLEDLDDLRAEEILLIHLDDMRASAAEALTDEDREFPGKGRGIERELLPRLLATGYDGFWSVELFNKEIWSWPIDRIVSEAKRSTEYIAELAHSASARAAS